MNIWTTKEGVRRNMSEMHSNHLHNSIKMIDRMVPVYEDEVGILQAIKGNTDNKIVIQTIELELTKKLEFVKAVKTFRKNLSKELSNRRVHNG